MHLSRPSKRNLCIQAVMSRRNRVQSAVHVCTSCSFDSRMLFECVHCVNLCTLVCPLECRDDLFSFLKEVKVLCQTVCESVPPVQMGKLRSRAVYMYTSDNNTTAAHAFLFRPFCAPVVVSHMAVACLVRTIRTALVNIAKISGYMDERSLDCD
jgi:hypothetical protein